ncbi:hypothetical protein BKA62DRAFT_684819 [Auriculariales sp. MPI-PUGE-AT-0066]|nr:hypothetical protein BKA62DRAFT_684819 [Auriculariales sp. MPI-PUGE-AT-0066]
MPLVSTRGIAALPTEVIEHIFMYFDDLETLCNAGLVCRFWASMYSARSLAIREAVAINALGHEDILLPALREVRVSAFLDGYDSPSDVSFDNMFNGITEENVKCTEITWKESKALMVRANILERLEVGFSRSRKDRLSGCNSRLMPEESLRFRRAICRAWVLSDVFRYSTENDLTEVWTFDDSDGVAARKAVFYSDLSNQDLYDLNEVVNWATSQGEGDPEKWLLLEIGPEEYAEIYETVDRSNLCTSGEFDDMFDWDSDITHQWEERQITLQEGIPKGVQPLVQPIGNGDMCSKCGSPDGLELWNDQNWRYLSSDLPLWKLGELGRNSFEANLLSAYIRKPNTDFSAFQTAFGASHESPYGKLDDPEIVGSGPIPVYRILQELFSLPSQVNSTGLLTAMAADAFATTLPSDWLCLNCLRSFVKTRYWIWWYDTKARGKVSGQGLKEDCWYGIDCHTQVHSLPHATKLNHLCHNTFAERQARQRRQAIARSGGATAITGDNIAVTANAGTTSDAQPSTSTATVVIFQATVDDGADIALANAESA